MSFTYDPTTSRGRVRLLVSDTNTGDSTKQIFTDAEIDAFLALESNEIYMAAAAACRALAADSARSAVAWRALEASLNRQQIPQHYRDLAKDYVSRAGQEPTEYIDHMDSVITDEGIDDSEYVGDIV